MSTARWKANTAARVALDALATHKHILLKDSQRLRGLPEIAQTRRLLQLQREHASHQVPRRSKKHAWKVARAAGRAS